MLRQVRVLFRVFLSRFFENDLAEDAGDFRLAFFALVALLAIPATAAPILIATASMPGHPPSFGWIITAHLHGVAALRQSVLSDKMLYLGYAMASSGLLAAIAWQSLLPDRRDARVLMPFGLHPRAVIAAKLGSLFSYLGLVAVGIHTLPSIAFGSLLAVDNTFTFAVRGIAAHFIASVGASLFVGLAIVALQALLLLALGPRRFTRATPALHFAVVAAAVGGLALLPAGSAQLGEALRSGAALDGAWRWLPTSWFLGLYESIVGTANPAMHALATWALASTAALVVVVIAVYPAVYRQTMNTALDDGVGHRRRQTLAAAFAKGMGVLVAREPRSRAVAQFFAAAIVRGPRQRLVIALGAGLAGAWAVPVWLSAARTGVPSIQVGSFAAPIAALFFITASVRIAAALPVEQGGDWLFDLTDVDPVRVRGVVVRTIAWLVVVPVVVISATICWQWWGWQAATAHAAFTMSLGAAILESVVGRDARLPCHGSWSMPVEHVRRWWPAYVIGVLFGVSGLSAVEYVAIAHPIAIACVSMCALTLAATIDREVARALRRPSTAVADAGATLVGALRSARLDTQRTLPAEDGPVHASARAMFGSFGVKTTPERWHDGLDLTPRAIWRDVRFAARRITRAPASAVATVFVLAAGIATLVVTMAIVDSFSGRSSDLRDASRVFAIGPAPGRAISWLDLQDLRARQSVFSGIEAVSGFSTSIATPTTSQVALGQLVTGGYFGLVGVRPVAGRLIEPGDDGPGAPQVAVIAESTWRALFHSAPDAIGQTIRISGDPFTIVGIAPASLTINQERGTVAVYVPLAHMPSTERAFSAYRDLTRRGSAWLHPIGRLTAGASDDQARNQVWEIGRALDVAAPLRGGAAAVPFARGWSTTHAAEVGVHADWLRMGRTLMLLPIALFLIVCTSLANLVLARGSARRSEFAIRRALGASRANLVFEMALELVCVAAAGGYFAWLAAGAGLRAIGALATSTFGQAPQYQVATSLDSGHLWLTGALVVAAVVIAGLVPAISVTSGGASQAVSSALSHGRRWRGRAVAIAAQVGLSLALLLVASLALNSVRDDASALAGAAGVDRLAVAKVPLSLVDRDDNTARAHVAQIIDEAGRIDGVVRATAISSPSAASLDFVRVTRPESAPDADSRRSSLGDVIAVAPGAIQALGVPILRGRAFEASDVAGGSPVAVITEHFAREELGGADVVGQQVAVISRDVRNQRHVDSVTIVGVAADVNTLRTTSRDSVIYLPLAQHFAPDVMIVVRAAAPETLDRVAGDLRASIRRVDVSIPIAFAGRADVLLGGVSIVSRVVTEVTSALSLLALIVTMVGLYGVLSQAVALRRREMGVRVALGATPRDIVRLVLRDGTRPVAIGVAAGVALAAIGRLSAQPLFTRAVSAIDLRVAVTAALPLVLAAAIACYLPARRASRVDPMRVLKDL